MFRFLAWNVHFDTCPSHFKLSIEPNQIVGLLLNYYSKNYVMSHGFENVVNGIFVNYTKIICG